MTDLRQGVQWPGTTTDQKCHYSTELLTNLDVRSMRILFDIKLVRAANKVGDHWSRGWLLVFSEDGVVSNTVRY